MLSSPRFAPFALIVNLAQEFLRQQRTPGISVCHKWVAKIGDFFAPVFVVLRRYFAPIGASRWPRIWYLAA